MLDPNATNRDPTAALPLEAVPQGAHRDLYSLWLGKREANSMPRRADFDPREMPRLLPHITLFDVEHDPLRFRIRLVGTAVVEATGGDNTGRYLDELECIEHTVSRCRKLVETGQPYFHADLPMPWAANDFRIYSVLGLPLGRENGIDMILGSLTFAQKSR
jgi:hypothetical protein